MPWADYELGERIEAPTGASMVTGVRQGEFWPGYTMVQPVVVERIGRQPPFDGSVWGAQHTYHGPCAGGRYVLTSQRFYAGEIGIIVADDGTMPCEAAVLQIGSARRGRTFRTPSMVGVRAFEPAMPIIAHPQPTVIKWELIYSGRSGDEVSLAYREYVAGEDGTFARPAFYQQLTYDLAASDRIVFQSLTMKIESATNAGVAFRVLGDER